MALLKRAVRRIEEGTSAVLLQSGLDEKWWTDSCGKSEFCQSENPQLAETQGKIALALSTWKKELRSEYR